MSKPGSRLSNVCGERKERRNQRRGGGHKERRGIGRENMPRGQKRAVWDWKGRVASLFGLCQCHHYLSLWKELSKTQRGFVGLALRTLYNQLFWEQLVNFTRELSSQRLTVWPKDQRFGAVGLIFRKPSKLWRFSSLLRQLRHVKIVIWGTYKQLSSLFTTFHKCQSSPNPWRQSRQPGWLPQITDKRREKYRNMQQFVGLCSKRKLQGWITDINAFSLTKFIGSVAVCGQAGRRNCMIKSEMSNRWGGGANS